MNIREHEEEEEEVTIHHRRSKHDFRNLLSQKKEGRPNGYHTNKGILYWSTTHQITTFTHNFFETARAEHVAQSFQVNATQHTDPSIPLNFAMMLIMETKYSSNQ